MAQIIDLRARQQKIAGSKAPSHKFYERPTCQQYKCTNCHAPACLFELFANGFIICGDCGFRISNLFITKGDKDVA